MAKQLAPLNFVSLFLSFSSFRLIPSSCTFAALEGLLCTEVVDDRSFGKTYCAVVKQGDMREAADFSASLLWPSRRSVKTETELCSLVGCVKAQQITVKDAYQPNLPQNSCLNS